MALLTGAITYLALCGAPGLPPGDAAAYEKIPDTSARPEFGATFTFLGPGGTPVAPWSFDAKAESFENYTAAVDTYRLTLTMGDVGDITALLTDTYRLALGMSAYALPAKAATDTYVPVLTLYQAALDKSTVTPRAGADDYVPVLTMTAELPIYQAAAADSYVPVLTLAATVSTSNAVVLTDSYVPVLTFDPYVQSIQAGVARAAADSYVPVLELTVRLAIAGEVDDIKINDRPYGLIRIEEA